MSRFRWIAFVVIGAVMGCSGGGGGGGGGSSQGRTTRTGIRIVHGSLDSVPLTVRTGVENLQTARYAEPTSYAAQSDGAIILSWFAANSEELVGQLATTLKENTEYTLFVYGEVRKSNVTYTLLEDQIVRSETGSAAFQLLNSFRGGVSVNIAGAEVAKANFGESSGFKTIASGPAVISVLRNGSTIAQVTTDVPDRGEITLLVSGDIELGALNTTIYTDLD